MAQVRSEMRSWVFYVLLIVSLTLLPRAKGFTQQLFINEIMSSNATTVADRDGDYSDWIEIYNQHDTPVNLQGFRLSDNLSNPEKWIFPSISVPAKSLLIVWASGKDTQTGSEIHTNFSISASGEPLILSNPQGEVIDQIEAIAIPTDISYGRKTDGSNEFAFFSAATPGSPNAGGAITQGVTPPISATTPPGFYTGEVTVDFTAADSGTKIHYTLDGSKPTPSSPQWQGSRTLSDRSSANNYFSMIRTTNHGGERGYRSPDGKVNKGTVVRTLAVKTGHEPVEQTFTYFVFPRGNNHYSLPVLSLVTDEENLFSNETGLFVPGNTYDASNPSPHYTGNYFQRGDEWERPANITYFGKNGQIGFQEDVGIRIHGGVTRHFPLKALRIYLRSSYGNSSLNYPLFNERSYVDARRFILRGSGNDYGDTYFRDAYAQQLVRHLDVDYQAYEPSILFVNGEYWGIHNIRERQDKYYLQNLFGVDPDNVDLLTRRNTVQEGDAKKYDFVLARLAQLNPNDASSLEEIDTYIDLDSHIDYMITQIYVANTDWPHNNIDFWRERVTYAPGLPKGRDGRFRWILYDTDFGLGHVNNADHNTVKWVTARTGQGGQEWPNFVFRKLLEHPEYKERFLVRFLDQLNTALHPDRTTALLADLRDKIAPEMEEHIKRWRQPSSLSVWRDNVAHMERFVKERQTAVRGHLREHFQINQETELTLNVNDPLAGFIQLNQTPIHPTTPGVRAEAYPWKGVYFQGVPITLTAQPTKGFLFDYWQVDGQQLNEHSLVLTVEKDTHVQAFFSKDPEERLTTVHYWHFDTSIENDTPLSEISATYSATELPGAIRYIPAPENAESSLIPGIMDRVNDPTQLNIQKDLLDELGLEESTMRGIRVRNPLEIAGAKGYLILDLPTTGHKEPIFSAAVSRTANGPGKIVLSYRSDESEDWRQEALSQTEFELSTEYSLIEVSFESGPGTTHNASLQLRIDFFENTENTSGNVRFNNVALRAFPLLGSDLITGIPLIPSETRYPFADNIYPNPTTGVLHIQLSAAKLRDLNQIQILDATGAEVWKSTEFVTDQITLQLDAFPPGLYLIHMMGKNQLESHKLIKK
ncbi:MAG: CotH kinase family protein [Lunatimonas sp.]|uniref:CotH kinase family protein n=1 Tax=Lunatimonas sp. TaxID=2060141 RepID=UPI00263AE549|nr:CotH kinase family protein [Lunatimonas sp.]MCC5937671.1 CotH kinase family protein [Lunatimonas sp.]